MILHVRVLGFLEGPALLIIGALQGVWVLGEHGSCWTVILRDYLGGLYMAIIGFDWAFEVREYDGVLGLF